VVTNYDPLSHDARLADNHPLAHDLLANDLLLHNHLLRSDERLHAMRLGDELLHDLRLVHDRGRDDRLGIYRRGDNGLDRLARRCSGRNYQRRHNGQKNTKHDHLPFVVE
jgi:hypothetical protein